MLYCEHSETLEQVVDAHSLEVFKASLDVSLSNLEVSLLIAGGLELDDLKGAFQLKPFYDL